MNRQSTALAVFAIVCALASAGHCQSPNPSIQIFAPAPFSEFDGQFAIGFKNWDYRPDLATDPRTQFNVGHDVNGDPLKRNQGHFHGWVFLADQFVIPVFPQVAVPVPSDYYRFYGAGSASEVGCFNGDPNDCYAYVFDQLDDPGIYIAFFVLQRSDHSPAVQASAAAFPPIASVVFWYGGR